MSAPGPYYGTHTQPIYQAPPPPPPPQFVYNPYDQPLTGQPQPQYYSQPHQYHGQPPPPPPDQYYPVGALPQNTGYQSQPQLQQQRNTANCCDSVTQGLMCCCAGMLCYMCLCDAMDSGMCMEGGGMDSFVGDD